MWRNAQDLEYGLYDYLLKMLTFNGIHTQSYGE